MLALIAAPPVRIANGSREGRDPMTGESGALSVFLQLKFTKNNTTMEQKTLDELWKSLDRKARRELLDLIDAELFAGEDAVRAWRRGHRPIPAPKRPKLAGLLERRYKVILKTA